MSWSDIFNSIGKFANSDAGKGLQNIAGLGMAGYGMYKQNKAASMQNDLLKKQNQLSINNYNYNKALNDTEIAKENMLQNNFTEGFSSVFGKNENQKKKKNLSDYYGMENYKG